MPHAVAALDWNQSFVPRVYTPFGLRKSDTRPTYPELKTCSQSTGSKAPRVTVPTKTRRSKRYSPSRKRRRMANQAECTLLDSRASKDRNCSRVSWCALDGLVKL